MKRLLPILIASFLLHPQSLLVVQCKLLISLKLHHFLGPKAPAQTQMWNLGSRK